MKSIKITYLALLTLLLSPMVANAIPITWDLENAFFDDGTEIVGSFDYDASVDIYSAWNVSVSDGTLSAYNYQPGVDGGYLGMHNALFADFVAFPASMPSGRFVNLGFANALSDAGGAVALNLSAFFGPLECDNCSTSRNIVSGQVVAASVPEPAVLSVFGAALLGFSLMKRRRNI